MIADLLICLSAKGNVFVATKQLALSIRAITHFYIAYISKSTGKLL